MLYVYTFSGRDPMADVPPMVIVLQDRSNIRTARTAVRKHLNSLGRSDLDSTMQSDGKTQKITYPYPIVGDGNPRLDPVVIHHTVESRITV